MIEATATSSVDAARRFGGVQRLYGEAGAQAIAQAHAIVVGVGGVGSWAAEALARSGIGALTLIDLDHVAESNINRQLHALDATLGMAKVEAMRARIAAFHPGCRVQTLEAFVEPDNWADLWQQACQRQQGWSALAVLDCCDHMAAKETLAAWARRSGALFITAGAAGGKRHGERVEIDDLAHATHDPLLAQLRQRLRQRHGAPRHGPLGVAAVFSREPVARPTAACDADGAVEGSLNCHGYGSLVTVTATFGLCAAGWVLNRLAAGHP
ncbi:MAG: tRNA threonylcarbamoyladenosine dehydratase [Tepidimonas sp.]|uniref:tRNA threonylcarbamoyladenosine dehydratase n=1 Tax=Tepidimonas sp. TaxID=2002775 RepID=UPI00298F3BE1|nr:tRNA threonylcarbamoyladenosine dehydratase [Tepidimonas sp.]MCS6811523.1 tRNA threonylcarbamoyladenosine dehydratase [Tepidimonas sp.]MDW8336310.1 tRNA threonylcarbamoyladenosine dehydratase [Tepidimonas sp.]